MTETKLPGMVINRIDKKSTYDSLVENGEIGENDLCLVEDEDNISPGSGTDISLGVTGASVGDIIKVKAVDDSGKPTAWETAKTQSLLRLVGEYTLSENATLFEVNNLNINADVISLRLKKGGTNCGSGISIWLNGVKSYSFVGTFSDNSDGYKTRVWLWKQDNQWRWYNCQTNEAINNGTYASGAISTPITSIGLSTPYMDGNTAEDVTEGKYIASGAVMQIYEGVFPNVN